MLATLASNRIYWTRQHGAYITLITSWIIALIITGYSRMQIPAIIFLLSSINVTELLTEKMTRKSPMPGWKNFWLNVYGLITFISAIVLLIYSHTFRDLILFLTAGALIFIVLARYKYQKSLPAELLTFAFFVVAAFTGSNVENWPELIKAMLVMTLYFGSSVFTVKQRFERVNIPAVIIYTVLAILLILLITTLSAFGIAVALLIFIKSSGAWLFPKQYHSLPIKTIGMLEAVFQLLLILIFVFLY